MYALVIGASSEAVFAIERAKKMGFEVVAFDGDSNALGLRYADRYYVTDIRQPQNIIKILTDENIVPDVILPVPIGRYLITSGAINDYYNLKGISYKAADACTDKYKFHRLLDKNGLRNIKCQCIEEGSSNIKDVIKFPAIIKPRYGSGSRAVSVAEGENDIKRFKEELPYNEDYIIEEMVKGTEYGIDGAVTDGKINIVLVRKKMITRPPARQCVGYYVLADNEIYRKVEKYLAKVVETLEMDKCVFHADIIINADEIFVIEISPRPSGHYLHNMFTPLATGVNVVDEYIKYAFGNGDYKFKPDIIKNMLIRFFDFEDCIIEKTPDAETIIEKYHLCRYVCNIKNGERMDKVTDGHSLMGRGYFVVMVDDEQEIEVLSKNIKDEFKIIKK